MRARNLVFHVNCFCCNVCHTPLTKGDQYGIIDASIYCRCVVQAGVGGIQSKFYIAFLLQNSL